MISRKVYIIKGLEHNTIVVTGKDTKDFYAKLEAVKSKNKGSFIRLDKPLISSDSVDYLKSKWVMESNAGVSKEEFIASYLSYDGLREEVINEIFFLTGEEYQELLSPYVDIVGYKYQSPSRNTKNLKMICNSAGLDLEEVEAERWIYSNSPNIIVDFKEWLAVKYSVERDTLAMMNTYGKRLRRLQYKKKGSWRLVNNKEEVEEVEEEVGVDDE